MQIRESIFKFIFNAVEIAINWDKDWIGSKLDNELSDLANIATSKAKQWRLMYVRLKYTDEKSQQATDYLRAKSQIPSSLCPYD